MLWRRHKWGTKKSGAPGLRYQIRKGNSFSLLGVKVHLRYIHGENTQWEQAEISSQMIFFRFKFHCCLGFEQPSFVAGFSLFSLSHASLVSSSPCCFVSRLISFLFVFHASFGFEESSFVPTFFFLVQFCLFGFKSPLFASAPLFPSTSSLFVLSGSFAASCGHLRPIEWLQVTDLAK